MSMPVKNGLYIDANYNLHYPKGMAISEKFQDQTKTGLLLLITLHTPLEVALDYGDVNTVDQA